MHNNGHLTDSYNMIAKITLKSWDSGKHIEFTYFLPQKNKEKIKEIKSIQVQIQWHTTCLD